MSEREPATSPNAWIVLALVLATGVACVDAALDTSVVLVGLLSAAPIVASFRAGFRGTAIVGWYALVAAILLGIPNQIFGTLDHLVSVMVVRVLAILSVRMASLRERAHRAGIESRNVVHNVFHSALDCIISMDAEGRVVDLNAAAEKTFGYERASALGKPLCDLIIPERLHEAHRDGLARVARGEAPRILGQRIELPALRSSGEEFPIELTVTRASSDPPLFTGFIRDITERRIADEERARRTRHASFLSDAGVLVESSLDYEATVAHIARLAVPRLADWAFVEVVQDDGSIERVAMAHSEPAKEALVREFDRRYPINPDAPEGSAKVIRTGRPELTREISDTMLEAVAEDPEHLRILRELGFRSAMVVPLRARSRTLGSLALVSAESGRLYDEGDLATTQELATRCALAIDNARLYEATRTSEAQMREQALRDPLTGLPNRILFLDRLTMALAHSRRRPGEPALFFIDLDGFKAVNDSLGHLAGDQLLKEVPARIEELLRTEDTISRLGGDEFAIVCEGLTDLGTAEMIAGRIVAALSVPFELEGRSVEVGISLGIAFAQGHEESPDSLLRAADAAMYEAKRDGGGCFRVSSAGSHSGPAADPRPEDQVAAQTERTRP